MKAEGKVRKNTGVSNSWWWGLGKGVLVFQQCERGSPVQGLRSWAMEPDPPGLESSFLHLIVWNTGNLSKPVSLSVKLER